MCASTSAAEYAGIDCGRKVYFICVSSSGLICVAVYVLTPLALVISRRARSTTSSLAALRSSLRAIRLEPPRPDQEHEQEHQVELDEEFHGLAWRLAGQWDAAACGARTGGVQDGRPFGMRLQSGDEAAAELRIGGQAAPALGEHAAQRGLGVDPGLGVGVAHVAQAVRRHVGGEGGQPRRQRIHEGARHRLHERRRRALGQHRLGAAGRQREHLAGLQRLRRRVGRARLHARRAGLGEGLRGVGLHGQDQRAAGGVGVGQRGCGCAPETPDGAASLTQPESR